MFGILLHRDPFRLKSSNDDASSLAYAKFPSSNREVGVTTRSQRCVAFLAVVFSTVAISACLFMFPLLFHYVQQLQANAQSEVQFCKMRTRDIWHEMIDVGLDDDGDDTSLSHRSKRRSSNDLCCTCQQGPPGPDGSAGPPGKDGAPGEDSSEEGSPGEDASPHDRLKPVPPQCPCQAPPGPLGPPGPPGNDGQSGSPGKNGEDGMNGPVGPPGPSGAPGQPGQTGQRGSPGEPGTLFPAANPEPGPPGASGRPGAPGLGGRPGQPGKDGDNGASGPVGDPGQKGPPGPNGPPGPVGRPGEAGAPGTCDHCPPARLAPGY